MGRRKIEMKPIENKSSRRVTFSKRRMGLIKKAKHLSVLCDVQVAVVVISSGGEFYEFCSSGNRVEDILSRYQKHCLEQENTTIQSAIQDSCSRFRTCEELLRTVNRLGEGNTKDEVSVTDMMQLEEELGDALMQTRSRKTELMIENISTLNVNESGEEKQQLEKQIALTKQSVGDEELESRLPANTQMNSHKRVTLPLFN